MFIRSTKGLVLGWRAWSDKIAFSEKLIVYLVWGMDT